MKVSLRILLVATALLVVSCGLFTPREITTEPADPSTPSDPFGFTMLLQGTGETFERHSWQDYFLDGFEYVNIYAAGTVYGKERIVSRLLQVLDLDSSISVVWSKPENTFRDEQTIILKNVAYTITSSVIKDSVLFTGNCDFEIVKESITRLWRIKYWKDFSQVQFFSPDKQGF